ncbi:hypothetical protein IEC97_09580 [Neobacillus cucumis]|uniref:hypothetical protein n=1 Tax=Neobacillus cucumis TaxID=1740721 RepID=UPI0018DF8B9C|nr:hypothetical protein [Neobacillus cucumis]MBI0577612.1 hypothetical protein [Neobacillus cucumis]
MPVRRKKARARELTEVDSARSEEKARAWELTEVDSARSKEKSKSSGTNRG